MANILILGAGSMGAAFSFPCSDNNHSINVVGTHLENDFIDLINLKNHHPALDIEIPKNVKFFKFSELGKVINNKIDLIVVAVISKGIEWASLELSKVFVKNIPILILTKGLAINNNKFEVLADKMERLLKNKGIENINITAAGGPCLAKGLASRVHTSVVFANRNIKLANEISKLVATDYYHISISDDVIGVEVCAAIKNIFSMGIGASQGLCSLNSYKNIINQKNSLNTAAALIHESINEMMIFIDFMKGKRETVMGLAGIGDLYVSADGGRNSKMGEYLGQGMNYSNAKKIKMPTETIEGADLALEIGKKVKTEFNIKQLPLMIAIIDTICEEKPLTVLWKNFK